MLDVLAARIIAWRELGAGYRRPAPTVCPVTACTLMAARGDGTSEQGGGRYLTWAHNPGQAGSTPVSCHHFSTGRGAGIALLPTAAGRSFWRGVQHLAGAQADFGRPPRHHHLTKGCG